MILRFNASLSAPAPAALLCTGKVNGEGVHPSGLKPALPADVSRRITVCLSKLPDWDQRVYVVAASVC